MKKVMLATMLIALLPLCAAASSDFVGDRVIQFLTNIHTGQTMKPDAWLIRDARNGERFKAYGGLDAVVKQTTSLAHEYGGVRSIEIRSISQAKAGFVVAAGVKFADEDRRKASPAIAEREDMVWTFRVEKERGVWKLAF